MGALLRWLDPVLNPLACLPPPPTADEADENAEALLRRLEALFRQRLRYAAAGEKRGMLKGVGLDFADLREYTPGDDVRKIDWNVFARTLTPHIREYHEDKQLTMWLAVDATESMRFGRGVDKLRFAVDLAGLFGLLAERAGHKLGLFVITDQIPIIEPPRSGRAQLQQIMRRLLTLSASPDCRAALKPGQVPMQEPGPVQEIAMAGDRFRDGTEQLHHLVQKNATVIMLGDFLAAGAAWHVPLGRLSRRARLVYLLVRDAVEIELPAGLGLISVQDPETGELTVLDTNDADYRAAYARAAQERQAELLRRLGDTGRVTVAETGQSPMTVISALLQGEAR